MSSARRFTITAVALALLAVLARVIAFRGGPDVQVHDTYFVLSPDRFLFFLAAFCGLFAAAYAAFPVNRKAANFHFWLTVTGISGFWISFYVWAHLIALRSSSQPVSSVFVGTTAVAFVACFWVLLLSPAVFAVNFTFAMGKMRASRRSS